jgi:hypothetical protein
MRRATGFLQVLALGAWVGAILYFAAVVTREAFAVLPDRDVAGVLVGSTLGGLHQLGTIAAVIFLAASLARAKSLRELLRPAAIGVILMLLLTLASQRLVMPRMATVRAQMVSVEATPPRDPRRAAFERLHGVSVDVEGAVLLIGMLALFLTASGLGDQAPD